MKKRIIYSHASSPARQEDTTSLSSPKIRLAKPFKELTRNRDLTTHLKPRTAINSREGSIDASTPSRTITHRNPRFAQDLKKSLENLSFEQNSKIYNDPRKQKLASFLKAVREFIGISEQVSDRLVMPSLSKSEINAVLKNYKSYRDSLEDAVAKMEKEFLDAPKTKVAWPDTFLKEDLDFRENIASHYTSGLTTSRKPECFDSSRYQSPGREDMEKFGEVKKTARGLKEKGAVLMKKLTTPSRTHLALGDFGVGYPKTHKHSDRTEYMSLGEESKKKDNDIRKLLNEIESLKNEKTKIHAECKKISYLYQMEKTSKDEMREAFMKAQRYSIELRESFNTKINNLQRILQNSFKGIESFDHKFQRGALIEKIKDIEKKLAEALREEEIYVQKLRDSALEGHDLESIREEYEAGSSNTDSYVDIRQGDGMTSPGRFDKHLTGEKELSEAKRNLVRLQKSLEEKDRQFQELYRKYQELVSRQHEIQEDTRTHVSVIERNLDIIVNKLEDVERKNSEQDNYEKIRKENDKSLKEVDTALKRCLDITAQAKKKILDITSNTNEVKSLLEKENQMLKDGLSNALDKVKVLDYESHTLRETLERSLNNINSIILTLEGKIVEMRKGGKVIKETDLLREKAMLEESIKSIVRWLKDLLKLGSSRQGRDDAEGHRKGYFKRGMESENVSDVMESCEMYVAGLESEREDLKEKVDWLVKKRVREDAKTERETEMERIKLIDKNYPKSGK